ncbi:ABC transporter ATP-binding protein [Agromyces atrinae]|uniref:ABC transporter ATP-binding protein n=1 Tax=Agromyces atrinae TaxID=592376 RepID=A0A4Q2MDU4_9MICO|nr:ABC transporter ATP-binding protein [Agromyces atrinae]MCI2958105.1 ABC transporter ATP-binding protein [Agromyces atrinae]NYD66590.1 iron complex transport system ATP-binding protein [Agromyces atrinae]RXZ87260.1 ABC transporter ATP-binding protein [Agromyces atrinae]
MTSIPAPTHDLRAEGLRLGYDGRIVVDGLDFSVPDGRITAIVGPNACGKSTLLRGLARLLRPLDGRVSLDGRSLADIAPRQLARTIAVLPQQPVAPDGVRVWDLVSRGRHPHQGWFRSRSSDDDRIVTEALTATSTLELADRAVDELSGGQRQRVWIAMVLAQQADIVLLDEPTSFLDLAHQVELLDLLTELNRTRGTTVVLVLHELNLAARYADHLVVMRAGAIQAQGEPTAVLTAATVREAFGLESVIATDPVSASPLVVPVGRFHPGENEIRLT